MASTVYFGSPRQARWDAEETLPAKLDRIIERLNIRERVKDETVAIKIHSGNNMGYSTLHPVFVRRVVQAVLDGGGSPFITDLSWDTHNAHQRGYSQEVLGCPIYPSTGIKDRYQYAHHRPYKNIQEWHVAGMIEDASFLINFSHVKGHPTCGYGAAFKNLALGCVTGDTRSAMHDTMHYERYWFRELCPDRETFERILASCPMQALVEDHHNPGDIHMHFEQCNQCGRCLKVAPAGSLKIQPENFYAFQEACAISASLTLSTFEPGKATHLALATQITPLCDCFGFTSMPILPDAGVFGSDDIVALETAILDKTADLRLIEENLPTSMEVHTREGHPFQWLHGPYKDPYLVGGYGEQLGMGSRQYELVDVYPVEQVFQGGMQYISAK
jgi:uncharacterized Fe-S center protein